MGIMQEIQTQEVWQAFLSYKLEKAHLSRKDVRFFDEFINEKRYEPVARALASGDYSFPLPEKKLLNKLGTSKKRVVYSFPEEDGAILKLVAFLLYRFDDFFAPNCFSFRRDFGVKKAVARVTGAKDIGLMHCYKLDIKNYFNSIDIDKLLPLLKRALKDDDGVFDFLSAILKEDRAVWMGDVIREKRGVMAGTPIAPFLANVYLRDLDMHFSSLGVLYIRYSDDIILFARTEDEINRHRDYIIKALEEYGLSVNPDKETFSKPGEPWEFLGFEYRAGTIDISYTTKRKIKGKIRRKARSLYRWKLRRNATDEKAMCVFTRVFNRKFFENNVSAEFTWAKWFFPIINTSAGLKEIDAYMQENMRYIVTGRHSKGNYRTTYDDLKRCNYRSLVNEYYKADCKAP